MNHPHHPRNTYLDLDNGTSTLTIIRKDGSEHHVLLDTADVPLAQQLTWRIQRVVNPATGNVWWHPVGARNIGLGRYLLGHVPQNKLVSFRDHEATNCCRANLMILSRSEIKARDRQAYTTNTGERHISVLDHGFRVTLVRHQRYHFRLAKTLAEAIVVRDALLAELDGPAPSPTA